MHIRYDSLAPFTCTNRILVVLLDRENTETNGLLLN